MGSRSCCGGIGGFEGGALGFLWVWCVVLFVWFGIGGGVLIRAEFDRVGGGRGKEVGGRWWHFVRGESVSLRSSCGCFGRFWGTADGFP